MARTLILSPAIAAKSDSISLPARIAKLLREIFHDFNRYADAAHRVHGPDAD